MRFARMAVAAVAVTLVSAGSARAQQIAQQVKQTENGTVRFMFASKPGVCGDGRGSVSMHHDEDGYRNWGYCEPGPVRVDLTVEKGAVTRLRTYVGGEYPPALKVSARQAVDYLLDLAQNGTQRVARNAIFPTLLADSVDVVPQLLAIARDQNVDREVRKGAIFWLGQQAGEKATAGLKSVLSDDDVEIRKSAVFALSQLKDDQSIPALIDVAKTSKDPELVKSALFWLGQKNDPRVLALYQDILLKK